ncbi:hypothetical protein ACLI4Q_03860 [Natrialbaceae archaeon A-CW1-1]
MKRRAFLDTGLAMLGAAVIAGCTSDAIQDDEDSQSNGSGFPSYDLPPYGEWIPHESHTPEESTGVYFTHVDWGSLDELEGGEDVEDEEWADIVEQVPIIGLPFYGALITPFTLLGIMFYPFAGDILPDNGGSVDGVETSTVTWTDDLLIFHGEYDTGVFEAQYTDGFAATEDQEGFTIYVGNDGATDGLAYALSEETLVVGMDPGDSGAYEPEELVANALNRYTGESDRMMDDEDGRWLFETTGQVQMAFGAWESDDLMDALDTDNAQNDGTDADENGLDAEPDGEAASVFNTVESVLNTISYSVENGEMTDIDARFSAIYPEDSVPSEEEVREHLIGEADVPHEIIIDGTRVHATATFEEEPDVLA